MFGGATLTIFDEFGNDKNIDLSITQLSVVVKILGIKANSTDEISCFSDDTLKRFVTMRGNPLNLVEKK